MADLISDPISNSLLLFISDDPLSTRFLLVYLGLYSYIMDFQISKENYTTADWLEDMLIVEYRSLAVTL